MTVIGSRGVSQYDIGTDTVEGGAVQSVFGRGGAVGAEAGDYSSDLITFVSGARAITSAQYNHLLQIQTSAEKNYAVATASELGASSNSPRSFSVSMIKVIASSYIAASGGGTVTSVFARTGAVVAASGDYNANQIAAGPNRVIMTTAQSDKLATIQSSAQVNPSAADSGDYGGTGTGLLSYTPVDIKAMVTAHSAVSAAVQSYSVSPFTTVARITQAGAVTYRRNVSQLPNNTIVITTPEELSAFKMQPVIATAVGTAGTTLKIPVTAGATSRTWLMHPGNKPGAAGYSTFNPGDSHGAGNNATAAKIFMTSLSTVSFGNATVWTDTSVDTNACMGTIVCEYLGASGDAHDVQVLLDNVRGHYMTIAGGGPVSISTTLSYSALDANKVIPFIAGINTNASFRLTGHAKMSGNSILEYYSPAVSIDATNAIVYPVEFRGTAWTVAHVSARITGTGTNQNRTASIMSQIGGAGTSVDIDWSHAVIFAQYQAQSSVQENTATADRPRSQYPLVLPSDASTVSITFHEDAVSSGAQVYAYILQNSAMSVFRTEVSGTHSIAQENIGLATSAVASANESFAMIMTKTSGTASPIGNYLPFMKSASTVAAYNSYGGQLGDRRVVWVVTMPRDS